MQKSKDMLGSSVNPKAMTMRALPWRTFEEPRQLGTVNWPRSESLEDPEQPTKRTQRNQDSQVWLFGSDSSTDLSRKTNEGSRKAGEGEQLYTQKLLVSVHCQAWPSLWDSTGHSLIQTAQPRDLS